MDSRLLAASAVWGLLVAVPYSLLRAWRHRDFDANRTGMVFLAGAAIPSFGRMLFAALLQNVAALPPDWPTCAALAGVVAVGLSVKELFLAFRSLAAVNAKSTAEQGDAKGASSQGRPPP